MYPFSSLIPSLFLLPQFSASPRLLIYRSIQQAQPVRCVEQKGGAESGGGVGAAFQQPSPGFILSDKDSELGVQRHTDAIAFQLW